MTNKTSLRDNWELQRENEELRGRLAKLSEAALRISESLDVDVILQGVIDGACLLTGAKYGLLLVLDESGDMGDLIISGLTSEVSQRVWDLPRDLGILSYLDQLQEPLRVSDISPYVDSFNSLEGLPPMKTFMGTPIRHQGNVVGNIYLTEKEDGQEFTMEDQETLVMFASQAAMVIINGRIHRDERRAKADLEALINISPVGVLVMDAKTLNIMSTNGEARRIVGDSRGWGRSLDKIIGSVSFRRMDGRELSLDELTTMRALTTGETVRAQEVVIHLPDGRAVPTLVNAAPIVGEDGEIVSVVTTLQDLTPREEMERQRSQFLGMVGHELRTPLTAIKGSTSIMLGATTQADPSEAREYFRIIDQQVDCMRDLINDLLDATRIEAGKFSVTPEPVEVSDLVEQARSACLDGGMVKGIEVDLPPGLPLIAADRKRIVQVLDNLFSNAAKYSSEAPTIRVSASKEESSVVVSVSHNGWGIPAERLSYLFKTYSRIGGENEGRHIAGEGLGLAICKGIVEAHGGRIWAESEGPESGARFIFTIPVADQTAKDASPGAGEWTRAQGKREPILVIDDDPQTLRLVRNTLWETGYNPILTGNPWDVERLIMDDQPHLILLDLMLPGTDGFEVMRSISQITDVPVIFLSGRGRDRDVARALELGADDYIVKPFSHTELVARIKAALRKRELLRGAEALEPYVLGNLKIDYAQRQVTVSGQPTELTATEYKILCELSTNAGTTLSNEWLLRRVWGVEYSDNPQVVRTFVKTLRRKLKDEAASPLYIFTYPGVGYRMPSPHAKPPPPPRPSNDLTTT